MGKRSGNTNTGQGVKGKKSKTISDDAGGKNVRPDVQKSCTASNVTPPVVETVSPVHPVSTSLGAW